MTDSGKPVFEPAEAARLVGKVVLLGLTHLDSEGMIVRREQLHGTIESVDERRGFAVALAGERAGERYWLPPDLRPFEEAAPGEYRLRATGEVVVDPDLLARWTVRAPE
jgi:hypothetical protein